MKSIDYSSRTVNIHGEQDSARTSDYKVFSHSVVLWSFIDFLWFISGIKHLNSDFPGTDFPGTDFPSYFSIFSIISVFGFPLLWCSPHWALISYQVTAKNVGIIQSVHLMGDWLIHLTEGQVRMEEHEIECMSSLQGMRSLGREAGQVTLRSNLVWKMITLWEGVKLTILCPIDILRV